MKKYFELKNRENEFVGGVVVDSAIPSSKEEMRENLLSSIEENNWFEDQSMMNAINILKQAVITTEYKKFSFGIYKEDFDKNRELREIVRGNIERLVNKETNAYFLFTKPGLIDFDLFTSEGAEEIGEQY